MLRPLGAITAAATARRLRQAGWQAPVPVLCCGNVTVGGAGKTTLALDLGERLVARGVAVAFVTRGYGGTTVGPLLVDPARHDAALTGDEPLLLAGLAPTWVSRDRAAGARAAVAAGAGAIILDDGLQNPSLRKTMSLLVVDGASGFGNGDLLPAGPLREPIEVAAGRCAAAVLIGADANGAAGMLPAGLPVMRAGLAQAERPDVRGRRLVAFAGIAHPDKFWSTLAAAGAELVGRHGFGDHHRFTTAELDGLLAEARRREAALVTTPKDAVRLPAAVRAQVMVLGVRLVWDDPAGVEGLLDRLLGS